MKLQKLVYYVKAWSLVDGSDVVADDVCRWELGPVVPSLYRALKANGRGGIGRIGVEPTTLDAHAALIADIVMYTYGRLSAYELSDLTHAEDPWSRTAPNEVIDSRVIREYYARHAFAANFPASVERPFFPLMTQSAYAYSFDMADEARKSSSVYPSFAEYRRIVDLSLEARSAFRGG